MKIVILQLARLGDILQTLPAVQGLKKAHPGCHITLVVRQSFADAARLSPHVDKLVEFSSRDILETLIEKNTTEARESAANSLAQWITREFLAQDTYDLLVNLTYSPASAYLTSLIPAKEKRGIHCAPDGGWLITDAWSQYIFAQVLGRNLNILHLNDLFARVCDSVKGMWPVEMLEPTTMIAAPKAQQGVLRIGMQVMASRPEKTLHPSVWTLIASSVLSTQKTAELVFFGSAADRNMIQEIISKLDPAYAKQCTVIAGTMKFHENIDWVRSCKAVISPDTAMVHLASLCNIQVIEIPMGEVKPDETGPYGNGHHVVYPANATAVELAEQIARIVGGRTAKPVVAQATTKLVACSNGTMRNEVAPKNFTPEEASNFFMKSYYVLAEFRCAGRQEDLEIPPLGDPGQPQALDRITQAFDALCTMRRVAEFGQHYCLKMLDNLDNQPQLTELLEKVAELEKLLASVKKAVPLVKPLVDTWSVAKDIAYAAKGDLQEVLAMTEGAYRELGQNIELIQQLLNVSVEAAQKKTGSKVSTNRSKEREI